GQPAETGDDLAGVAPSLPVPMRHGLPAEPFQNHEIPVLRRPELGQINREIELGRLRCAEETDEGLRRTFDERRVALRECHTATLPLWPIRRYVPRGQFQGPRSSAVAAWVEWRP